MQTLSMQAMTQVSEYSAFMLHMRDVINNAKVIQALFKLSEEEWERSRDINTDQHLIADVFTSGKKSDAIRIYIAKLVKLHLNTHNNRLTTWTKDTISSENAANVAITSRINATELKSNMELFKLVAGRLIGYDDDLIRFALADSEDSAGKALFLMKYMSSRFDLTVEGLAAHDTYIDQTDRLEELFASDGFNDQFFFGHSQEAIAFFAVINMTSVNHWDLFEKLDVTVRNKVYFETNGALMTLVLDKDDPDPSSTIAIARSTFFEANPRVRDILTVAQLSIPQIVDSIRGCTSSVALLDESGTQEGVQELAAAPLVDPGYLG